jgi:hypothetical protein
MKKLYYILEAYILKALLRLMKVGNKNEME